ncbi:unnamed protein product [Prunus armeniaca]
MKVEVETNPVLLPTSPRCRAHILKTETFYSYKPSNWRTNSQPERTTETLKACTPITSLTRADYPIKGLQQHPVKDAPGSDNSKYLKFSYPTSKSGEVHRVVLIALQTDILYSNLSTISTQQPKYPTHR